MMNIKLHRLQTGAQQIKVLKRQFGEELIAKFGIIGELRHGLASKRARVPKNLSQPPAPTKSASDGPFYATISRRDRPWTKINGCMKKLFVSVQFCGTA